MRITDAATIPRDRITSRMQASVTLQETTAKDLSVVTVPVSEAKDRLRVGCLTGMPRRHVAASLLIPHDKVSLYYVW